MNNTLSLQEQAYNILLKKIINFDYLPGQKISEKSLVSDLQLSRTPVHEALLRLQREGLVYTIPQSGTYITKIDFDKLLNAQYVRENLEKKIMADVSSTENISLEDARTAIYFQEKHIESGNVNLFFDEDEKFHRTFYQLTGHDQIWEWMKTVNIQFIRFRSLRLHSVDLKWDVLIEQHKKILEAVEKQNVDEAVKLTENHLRLVFKEEPIVIKSFPDYFENLPEDFLKD